MPQPSYDHRMPTLVFWLLVIAAVLFFKLTTRVERRTMVERFWVIIALTGAVGFAWQLLLWSGALSP